MKIQVITKIPNPDTNDGNLYNDTMVFDIDKTNKCPTLRPIGDNDYYVNKINNRLSVKLEAFQLGELIIVDDEGREIGGLQRKVYKWPDVRYKEFEMKDIDKAVKLSDKISNV